MHKKIIYLMIPLFFFINSCSDDDNSIDQDATEETSNDENTDETDTVEEETSLTISEEILKLVNEHRESIGLSSLSRNKTAEALAIDHTDYMVSQGETSHVNFEERFDQLQVEENALSVSENVAFGFPTAEAVVSGWLESGGHRDNIEGNYTHTGIAAVLDDQGRYYFTQLFYR